MAGNDLVAALLLKLQDQLTGPLRKVQEQMERLGEVARGVQLDGLDGASEELGQAAAQATRLEQALARVKSAGAGAVEVMRAVGSRSLGAVRAMGEEISGTVRGVVDAGKRFGHAGGELINRGFGAAVEGFAVYDPIKRYAEYENIVRHIGITEGRSGDDLDKRSGYLKEFFQEHALSTGQTSESIAKAYQDLVQMGIKEDLEKVIQAHSKAATAYNTSAEALGPAVGALVQTLKVPAEDLSTSLAAMAQASKEGRFKVEDFSRELPGVAAQFSLLGMTGKRAASTAFAALETVMRGSSNPSQAATNLSDLLQYIRNPVAQKHFAAEGINLHAVLERGAALQKTGKGNTLDVLLDVLQARSKGLDQVQLAELMGKLFHNQQAGSAAVTLLQQRGEYEGLQDKLNKIDKGIVERDFISAFKAPEVQLRIMGETAVQITRRLGEGFLPVLKSVNFVLYDLNEFIKWGQQHYPRWTNGVLAGVAGLLLFGAALGLLGAVVPVITAGFGVLTASLRGVLLVVRVVAAGLGSLVGIGTTVMSVILIAVAAIAAAAYDIYENWGKFSGFFESIMSSAGQFFQGFDDFVGGIFTLDMERAAKGVEEAWQGFSGFFSGLWNVVKQLFQDFVTWVDGWSGGLGTRILKGLQSGWATLVEGVRGLLHGLTQQFDNSALGRLLGLAQAKAGNTQPAAANDNPPAALAGKAGANGTVHVVVTAAQGAAVTKAEATGGVAVQSVSQAPNRGRVLGRP